MGDHGRSTLGHVVAKKSRGYYCPPGGHERRGVNAQRTNLRSNGNGQRERRTEVDGKSAYMYT